MNKIKNTKCNLACLSHKPKAEPRVGYWSHPVIISKNNFKYKSLSNFSCNHAVGCRHGCRVCYVPSTTTNKLAPKLAQYGVQDPDSEWGEYLLLRTWDEHQFLNSLQKANAMPKHHLKPDGHRAVMFCSTTDPYQIVHHPNPSMQRELMAHSRFIVRRSLELIRDHSTLNVRILTRSPLAKEDFDLFQTFGNRLLFGMSLPTLRNDLSKVYEPQAPSPTQRLATLQAAKNAGLNVYVAMAATFPECDENDLRETLQAIASLEPFTIFHEPINIRAENVERIKAQAKALNLALNTQVFSTRDKWRQYALGALRTVEKLGRELKISRHLHLWPDATLGSALALRQSANPDRQLKWLNHCWQRISEWPKTSAH